MYIVCLGIIKNKIMQKKINLEEILNNTCDSFKDEDGNQCYYLWQIKDFGKEIVKQTLELAAENAELVECDPCEFYINKQSILDVINLIE